MGWGRMLLFGNFGQQMDLDDHEAEIASLRRKLERSTDRVARSSAELQRLTDENDELKLYIAAILRVLVSKNVVTQAELQSLVQAIDREDGEPDGGFTGNVMPPGGT